MQSSKHFQHESVGASLYGVGGEPLAGSGFEPEEPDPGFSTTRLGGEE
jgi:hypothetical protein